MKQNYSPDLIREWSYYLRTVANGLYDSSENSEARLAVYFYDVHHAIGPEDMLNILSLDEEYLRILAEKKGKTPEKVMKELIESLEIVIREGDRLRPETEAIRSVWKWNSDLRDYLCDLKEHLENNLAKDSAKRSKMARGLGLAAASIFFFLTGVFYSSKYEPRILLILGCMLVAILLFFFSLRKEKK